MTVKTKRAFKWTAICAGGLLLILLLGALVYEGFLWPTQFSAARFPVKGVDVSEYQGNIHWDILKKQGIEFAFIKATEGSSYTDPRYPQNAQDAANAGISQGAYHFFSFDSPGKTQAENFLNAVDGWESQLPPVVDVELYGRHKKSPPGRETVQRELDDLVAAVQAKYGAAPLLYATGDSYARYLSGSYPDCPVWIRDVLKKPKLPDGREPLFWQYSPRGRLDGLSDGEERFIDLNVFFGSREEYDALLTSQPKDNADDQQEKLK